MHQNVPVMKKPFKGAMKISIIIHSQHMFWKHKSVSGLGIEDQNRFWKKTVLSFFLGCWILSVGKISTFLASFYTACLRNLRKYSHNLSSIVLSCKESAPLPEWKVSCMESFLFGKFLPIQEVSVHSGSRNFPPSCLSNC